ncbi:MAG: GTP cyclohydrolase I FolE2 [Betaproteobacteria bacterium]|nr:GTP cyclohydrolase I FolE2 [Betaproteobacteria bacterium]
MNQRDTHLPLSAIPSAIADVQSSEDTRRISIDRVGIKALRHPIRIKTESGAISHSVATFNMNVRLAHNVKGTHMSRFVAILETNPEPFSAASLATLLEHMVQRLEVTEGRIEMEFPFFIEKAAPVSGVKSLLDYQVSLSGEIRNGSTRITTKVVVPVTSLCPCSKEISAYGAHNQRSHITIAVRGADPLSIEEVVRIAEEQASCELYGLLKRPDEKFVTERAYDNPKFVEDLVRDVAAALNANDRVEAYVIESENFESIHNHSAYAMIECDKSKA